jgi:signal transduction histidine kinase
MPTVLHLASNHPSTEGVDFEQLFDELPDPAIYVGADNRIAACNRNFRERFPIVVESRFLERLQNQLATSVPIDVSSLPYIEPKRQSLAGGKTQPALQPKVTQLPSGGTLVVFRPATSAELECRRETEQMRQEVRCATAQLRTALDTVGKYKKNFANAGHELRTPLNAIVGFADMMRQQTFGPLGDAHYARYADIIHNSGLRLLDIINEILDFAKLDAGKLELRAEEVEILGVVVDSVRELEALAIKSRIGICVHVSDSVSVVVGDRNRLRQMLVNLLSNALKFTPSGGEICIDVYKRGENVALAVSDTGIGMREGDIETALEPFGQVKGESQCHHRGTGLGLPLTKQLAELHGGAMEIESVYGFGTTITILLPNRGLAIRGGAPQRELSVVH